MSANWHRLLIVVVLTIAYATTLARGIGFGDGPEITTANETLGVMHPTGYPLFTMVVHVFNRVESSLQYLVHAWGTIVELLSVLAGDVAVAGTLDEAARGRPGPRPAQRP